MSTSLCKPQTSKRELVTAFGIGLFTTLSTGAALGFVGVPEDPVPVGNLPQELHANTAHARTSEHAGPNRPSCSGGQEVDFKLQVVPTVQGDGVRVEFSLSNQTKVDLNVATVTQLVALDGSVVHSLPAQVEEKAQANGAIASSSPSALQVPEGYYTLWVTALGVPAKGAADTSGERNAEAVVYLYSDGNQVRLIDYSEWYFNSGAVEFGPSDEEHSQP